MTLITSFDAQAVVRYDLIAALVLLVGIGTWALLWWRRQRQR